MQRASSIRKQALIRKQAIIFLTLVLATYVVTVFTAFLAPPPLANILGFLSLLLYVSTVIPSNLRKIAPELRSNQTLIWLLKNRRYTGVAAFGFALNHGVLLAIERNLDFLDFHTYIHYFQGISSIIIFTLLTITSHDQAVKMLKANWRRLHQLTYLAIFILPWHILDKMSGHWTQLTPFGAIISVGVTILFIRRKWVEQNETKMKTQAISK